MFRLDYLSCFLTVVATILVGARIGPGSFFQESTALSSASLACIPRNMVLFLQTSSAFASTRSTFENGEAYIKESPSQNHRVRALRCKSR